VRFNTFLTPSALSNSITSSRRERFSRTADFLWKVGDSRFELETPVLSVRQSSIELHHHAQLTRKYYATQNGKSNRRPQSLRHVITNN
jgi:hypothetical protein